MKRIGVVTIHKSPNYGACLQSFGLYKFLNERGYDVEVVDLHRPTHADYIPSKKYLPLRQVRKGFLKKIKGLFFKKKIKKEIISKEAKNKFDVFNAGIKLSKAYRSIDELYRNPPIYDIYISGSDQLWNPTIGFCIEPYFLTFAPPNAKKISYATSIGVNELRTEEKSLYRSWLQNYGRVSVRENSAKLLLETFCDFPIEQVADPSFLLNRGEWQSMAIAPNIKQKYILVFSLNYNALWIDFAKRMKAESRMEVVYLCLNQPGCSDGLKCEKDAGPNEWLGYIANAEMVFTDSFHGTVFSIILQAKNFFAYVPSTQKRGKRITDLLATYDVSNHCFMEENLQDPYKKFSDLCINPDLITEIYLKEQDRSRNYLIKSIDD